MAGDVILEEEEENILFDLLINTEWQPETDTQLRGLKEHNSSLDAKAVTVSVFFLYFSPSSSTLPPGLVRLATKQLNWQLVLASNGKLLAVVQDQLPKDPNPHWRRVAWSHDCALLAHAYSTGTVRVFDLMGSELSIIPPIYFSYAAAGLMFLEYTTRAQWLAELLVITYSGQLKSYLCWNQGFQENHTFSFSAHYCNAITTAIYHPGHRLLLVGGCESGDSDVSRASRCGITAWRVLSGSAHHKQVISYEDDISASQRQGFFRMPSFRLFLRHNSEQDGVFRMSLSPDGTVLAVIHFSGSLSLWDIPSFKLRGSWKQEEQPGFDEINPEWKTSLEKRKKIKDVSWWSETALILACCSGALTVSSVCTLKNLLGKSCEWFETSIMTSEEDDDSDSDEEFSAKACYFGHVKQGLNYVTEMESFTPPRKQPRTVIKNYCLVSLRSTTQVELYQRKIDNKEYGEAFNFAQAYGLDSDLVYQRQWRKSTVSITSNQDYLVKLLQYGPKGTDLEALIAIGDGEDQGRFILSGDLDLDNVPYEDFLFMEEELEQRKEREANKRQEVLKYVDFSKLTLEQKELWRSRLKLLCYLDHLATYEEILGGPHAAEQRFDAEFFKKFRNQNIVLSARTYSRESNVQALDILFTYYGSEQLQHQHVVLFNFPETTSPHEHSDLLPKAGVDKKGNLSFIPWEESRHRDLDWCEVPECRGVVEPDPVDDCHFLYEEQPELERFCSTKPSITLLTEWYLTRAQDIESNSRQVDCALSLVRLGKEQNIPGLEVLCNDLVTMETLVYETSCDLSLALKELQQLRDIDKLRLLMKNCSEDRYVRNSFQWMVPFLHRCEGQRVGSASTLLREYLVTLAKDDPALPLEIFQHSKPDVSQTAHVEVTFNKCTLCVFRWLIFDLVYFSLFLRPESDTTKALHDQVDTLEKHLSVVEELEKHGLQKPISFMRNSQNSKEEAHRLMVLLARHTGRKNPPVRERVWRSLLQDLLDMLQNVYTCPEPETCHQVFVESLLCSGREENIRLAGQLMHCSAVSEDTPVSVSLRGKAHARVSYSRSMELILAAAREYFNSSATLSDPCMNLPWSCLLLITDCPSLVQEELDLISECISQCPTAYRQSSLLLSLARYNRMKIPSRKGQMLTLLAVQADLIAAGYSDGWYVCAQLGQCEMYSQLSTRQELMAFVLTHCPPSSIQNLLAASSSLQTQVLYQAVNYKTDPSQARRMGCEMSEQAGAAVPGSINPRDLLHRTTAHTIEVLTNTTMTTIAVLTTVSDSHWWRESLSLLRPLNRTCAANQNADLERQGCSPLYKELFTDPYVNTSEDVYSSYDYTPQEDFAEVLLRTGKLAKTNSEGQNLFPATEVLLQLASDAFPKDMTLALAYLLALPQVLDASTCFEKKPPSALSLQLAAYYYSLQIYSSLALCFKDKCSLLYQANPRELIHLVTKHVTNHAGCDWRDEELQALISQLRLYNERLTDFTRAQVLQGLGHGVDVQRFSSDNQYKKKTILGLSCISIYLSFLSSFRLSTKDIEDMTEALGLFETLKMDPELLKLLKKLKAIAVGLDYKKLTDDDSVLLEALEPVLTSQNLSISKLAPRIPKKGGEALSSSAVHATWLNKLFWEGDQHVLKKGPQSDHNFLHAYDTCAKYFDRLLPVESVNFLNITKHAQKALKGISKKSKKKDNDDRSENSSSFDLALTHIQQSLAHLETMSHSFLLSLKTSQEELLQKYSRIYDLSRSEESKVHHLAVTMAMDGQPLEQIQQLLTVSVGTSDLSPKTTVQDAVERIITALSSDKDALKDYADPLKVLEGIVAAVHTDDMLAWLQPFCGDDSKPVRPRIEVLQILEHSFSLSDQDIHLLVFFRSQAVLRACWPNRKCVMKDVKNEEKRNYLFLELLESSNKWEEFQHLMLLLQAWPPVTDKSKLETEQNPWVGLTILSMCRSLYPTKYKLNPQCTGYICSLLLNPGIRLNALKLMTESKDEHLMSNYVEKAARDLHQASHSAEAGSLLLSYRGSQPGQFTFNSAHSVIRKWL
uniref:NBAS subunit of NRZ tethering complex n=1 Tax=Cyprinus carpio TaxID=7962 RepID=A0A8C2EEM5_CYPCA